MTLQDLLRAAGRKKLTAAQLEAQLDHWQIRNPAERLGIKIEAAAQGCLAADAPALPQRQQRGLTLCGATKYGPCYDASRLLHVG